MKAVCSLLLLLPALALSGSPGLLGLSSPLLIWSNRGIVGEGQGKQVSYQVVSDVEEVASGLVLKALGKAAESTGFHLDGLIQTMVDVEESRTVVVFIGSQLDAADLRSGTDAIKSLDSMLGGAVSSVVVPYATTQGASLRESVCSKLDAADVQHEVVGCSVPSTDLKADVAAALAKRNGAQLNVVIVCSHTEPAQENTNAGLALEVEQLKEVQAAVEEAGVGHVFVYGSQTKGQAPLQGGKRRALMSSFTGFGPYTVCGPLCQTQVRWLEGMLGMLILALASCSGLVCLYVLDTPTRFEAPKDLAPQQ